MGNKKHITYPFIAAQRSEAKQHTNLGMRRSCVAFQQVSFSCHTRHENEIPTRLHHHKVEVTAMTLSISLRMLFQQEIQKNFINDYCDKFFI